MEQRLKDNNKYRRELEEMPKVLEELNEERRNTHSWKTMKSDWINILNSDRYYFA